MTHLAAAGVVLALWVAASALLAGWLGFMVASGIKVARWFL